MMRGRFVASWSREWDGRVIGVVVLCDEVGGVIVIMHLLQRHFHCTSCVLSDKGQFHHLTLYCNGGN